MFHAPRSECLLRDWLRRMRRSSILVSHVEKLCFFQALLPADAGGGACFVVRQRESIAVMREFETYILFMIAELIGVVVIRKMMCCF